MLRSMMHYIIALSLKIIQTNESTRKRRYRFSFTNYNHINKSIYTHEADVEIRGVTGEDDVTVLLPFGPGGLQDSAQCVPPSPEEEKTKLEFIDR